MMIALQSDDDLEAARAKLRGRGLDFSDPKELGIWRPPYKIRYRVDLPDADVLKSWDVADTLRLIEANVPDKDAPILDIGGAPSTGTTRITPSPWSPSAPRAEAMYGVRRR